MSTRRRPRSPEELEAQRARALSALDRQLLSTRSAISRAALSCLRAEPAAATLVRDALAALDAARELLPAAEGEEQ